MREHSLALSQTIIHSGLIRISEVCVAALMESHCKAERAQLETLLQRQAANWLCKCSTAAGHAEGLYGLSSRLADSAHVCYSSSCFCDNVAHTRQSFRDSAASLVSARTLSETALRHHSSISSIFAMLYRFCPRSSGRDTCQSSALTGAPKFSFCKRSPCLWLKD